MSPKPELLPVAEIRRLLQKYSNEGTRGARRVNVTAIAAMVGVDRYTLNRYKRGESPISEHMQEALTPILRDVESGRMIWGRKGQIWEVDHRETPVRLPPPQDRIIRADDFNEWASCRSCGGTRFSKFKSDKVYWACDGCVGETDRRMVGGHNM